MKILTKSGRVRKGWKKNARQKQMLEWLDEDCNNILKQQIFCDLLDFGICAVGTYKVKGKISVFNALPNYRILS